MPLLQEYAEALLELVFPTVCAGCDLPGELVCDQCATALPIIETARACPRCGAPECRDRCPECGQREFAFSSARCAGVFEPPLSRCVVLHKDQHERRLGRVLASLLADAAGDWLEWADVVVGVPASRSAVARRGFDHGAALAKELATLARIPAIAPLRARARGDQRALGRADRAANLGAGFQVVNAVRSAAEQSAMPARVLLIDDVLTTGVTLDAAARTLLGAGACEVRALAVARACRC